MFSTQTVYCPACGVIFETNFNGQGGYGRNGCCSKRCHEEIEWRRTLSILGKPYRKDPRIVDTEIVPRGLSGYLIVTSKK